ncbi:twin-arginine translocation pathway signal [Fusarium sp. NRRL 52700]|nr:twin-arginine translocation pathway signal [Fusarium sp. NRRL 52700]
MISDDLTRAVKVITTHDVLKAASIDNPEKYLPNEDVEVDNVTKVLKVVITIGVGEVPVVGGMLSGLIGLFWPGGDDSIWEGTKDNVERLVDEKIGEQTAEDNRLRLKDICKVLKGFAHEPADVQTRGFHRPSYKETLEEEVRRLQALVQKAKKDCIERRKKDIKMGDMNFVEVTMEDPHSHTEVTVTGSVYSLGEQFKNCRTQLDFEVESKYSAEIDKILEPTRLWGRFIPGHERDTQTYHHLEYPGGEWKGITADTKFTNPQAISGGLGRLCTIEWCTAADYYGTKEVVRLSLVYENGEIKLGSSRGGSVHTLKLGKDVIVGVTTKVSTDYKDRDRIEYIGFTYAPATIDAQGNLRYGHSTVFGNDFQPRYGVEYKEFTYTSEDGKSPPTSMLYAVGWSHDDPIEGYLGMFQPVFGCLETIEEDGTSTWSFENYQWLL